LPLPFLFSSIFKLISTLCIYSRCFFFLCHFFLLYAVYFFLSLPTFFLPSSLLSPRIFPTFPFTSSPGPVPASLATRDPLVQKSPLIYCLFMHDYATSRPNATNNTSTSIHNCELRPK
jgi:hypothetical protein